MPAGFEAHLSFFTAAPEAVSKLGHKATRATRQALAAASAGDSNTAFDHGEQLLADTHSCQHHPNCELTDFTRWTAQHQQSLNYTSHGPLTFVFVLLAG